MAKRRRRLSAKQIAAGFGGKRRRSSTSRRRTRSNPVQHRARRRRTRRNPMPSFKRARRAMSERGITSFVGSQLIPAGVGALGALALDMAWPYLPLPASIQSGPIAPVVRLATAAAIGWGASIVTGRKFARQVAAGALTVTIYDIAKGYLQNGTTAPTTAPGTSAYVDSELGYSSAAKRAGRLSAYVN